MNRIMQSRLGSRQPGTQIRESRTYNPDLCVMSCFAPLLVDAHRTKTKSCGKFAKKPGETGIITDIMGDSRRGKRASLGRGGTTGTVLRMTVTVQGRECPVSLSA